MLTYPEIDPVAVSIGPLTVLGKTLGPLNVHWYGLMYLFGFAAAWAVGVHRSKRPYSPVSAKQVEDLVFYGALGVVLGARIGYVFFYNFGVFLQDPMWLFRVWEGGMSFHGGLLGVLIAMWWYCKKIDRHFIDVMDFFAPLAPLGLCFGRIGNFVGQELWGRETTFSLGMVFPNDPDQLVRHPSQLYQASLEGLALFVILFWFSHKPKPRGAVAALLLICYGCFRFIIEFVREPDAHIQFDLFGWVTRGQILSIPMIAVGVWVFVMAYRNASIVSSVNK